MNDTSAGSHHHMATAAAFTACVPSVAFEMKRQIPGHWALSWEGHLDIRTQALGNRVPRYLEQEQNARAFENFGSTPCHDIESEDTCAEIEKTWFHNS